MKLTDNIDDLTPLTDRECKLTAAIEKQNARIEKLYRELHDCKARCEMLEEKLHDRPQETTAVLEETAPDIKSQMLDYLLMERGPAE